MRLLKFLISKTFLLNLMIAIALIAIGIFIFFQFLDSYTLHNESMTVPDLKGLPVEEVEQVVKEKNLRYEINDSVYVPEEPKLTVIEQNPSPRSKVKQNRKIYLTINSPTPPKVKMPNLRDVSLRQGLVILESYGLKVGELNYVPDVGHNVILEMEHEGRIVRAGDQIEKGSTIDLTLGDGYTSNKVEIPNLRGITLDEAMFLLRGSGLNIGGVIYEDPVEDSAAAIIFKQYPLYKPEKEISQGEAIDVWLTTQELFDEMDIPEPVQDSTEIDEFSDVEGID